MKDYIKETLSFGLDIGTRTVIGVVGYKENSEFVIVAYERREHQERAMLDGQIHDIQKVAEVVYQVKTALEKKLGIKLTEVAIAAAGRTLSTQIVELEHRYDEIQEFTLTDIHHLELEGVEKAKEEQQRVSTDADYFCVAYSVINYYLNEYMMANLEGQKGTSIGLKLLATFLPKQVIDSLYAVTERAELTVSNLTLEPIAAINAIIPENIRLLNLALVDIGAGTSDIAITKDGSVIAYGMIPVAGDEVTEAIVHKYLVDFNTAEKMKQQMNTSELITFEDILGLPQQVTVEELKKTITPVMDGLIQKVADKIQELNGDNAPNAVFCVGGGSQMMGITECLASRLNLAEQRVAVRLPEQIVKVRNEASIDNNPEMITPIGICITASQNKYSQFTIVTLNGQQVQLMNAKKLTILDAIVASGIEHTDIFPKRGRTLMFKCNGERVRIKGEKGIPAVILLNGKEAAINDHIVEGDCIEVELGIPGKAGMAFVEDYISDSIGITLNGNDLTLPLIKLNEKIVGLNEELQENDNLEVIDIKCLREVLEALKIDTEGQLVTVNFNVVTLDYQLQNGDSILVDGIKPGVVSEPTKVDHDLKEEPQKDEILQEESLYIVANGKVVALPKKESSYMLASIFDFIEFDLSKPQGTIKLIRNSQPASLVDLLEDGDVLEIYWKK